jgi:hypothetical protein
MAARREIADDDLVSHLTAETPLSRYCVVGGEVRVWVQCKTRDRAVWVPLVERIEGNELARAAAGALLRAGVREFGSDQEAAAWGRNQTWTE